MKKAIGITLALLMAASLLACAAPSGGASSGDVVELTFWGHQEDTWNTSYRAIADAFMAENPDIKINFEFFPYDEFESKVQTSLISKSGGADLYEIWGGWGVDYASTGALAAMPRLSNTRWNTGRTLITRIAMTTASIITSMVGYRIAF